MEVNFDSEINFATEMVTKNGQQLSDLLTQLVAQVTDEFTGKKADYLKAVAHLPRDPSFATALSNATIVFTDYFRRLARKLENVTCPRNVSYERNDFLVDCHSKLLTDDEKKKFSSLFGAICRYGSKSNTEMNYYSDPKFCSYIITKTYKKTYNEVTDFLPLVVVDPLTLVNTNPIRIAAIGGGPGNDGLAIADYLRDKLPQNIKIFVDIYDLNATAWETANRKPLEEAYKDSSLKVHWRFVNHLESDATDIKGYDFVSACWTLNEHTNFNPDFWAGVVRGNSSAKFLVIEGEKKNIEKLYHIFVTEGLTDIYFERMANPRRLFAQQKAEAPLSAS
jgi:hypothetical protein